MSPTTSFSYATLLERTGRAHAAVARPVVCVQGLGFVGVAMAVAVANARDSDGRARFNVVGVDLPTPGGCAKVDALNSGTFPIATTDPKLGSAFESAFREGNLVATTDSEAYSLAAVTVVDIHLDLDERDGRPYVNFDPIRAAMAVLGKWMQPRSLVLVETTVPPGTCGRIVAPALAAALQARGLPLDAIHLAHSYERVMPGDQYFDSLVNYWRVYAADTPEAADACGRFLEQVINAIEFPLTRLGSTLASETAKVLENSYRAANIAFIDEWARFAESVGIDLFEVVEAIRRRPTHANIRQPGFGVGGYCLTKDLLFASCSSIQLFKLGDHAFPFCERAAIVNRDMPLAALRQITVRLGGDLHARRLLLLGVSYRQDVGDTRYSPSETFYRAAIAAGAAVVCHDPLVRHWQETGLHLPVTLPDSETFDAVVFAVSHEDYRRHDWLSWVGLSRPLMFDANHVLDADTLSRLAAAGCPVGAIGKGLP